MSSDQQTESRSILSNSLRSHGLYSPWNSPGQNTGVGSFFPSPVDLPKPVTKSWCPALQVDSLPTELSGKPWTSPEVQCQNQIDYILCSQRWRSSIRSAKTRPGADCGSDHGLLIAKFRLKLKKAGTTSRPFRYDLNQIPSDYTVEVRNRFKGLDLIDRMPEELWTEVHDLVHETVIKTIPKKMQKGKMVV